MSTEIIRKEKIMPIVIHYEQYPDGHQECAVECKFQQSFSVCGYYDEEIRYFKRLPQCQAEFGN